MGKGYTIKLLSDVSDFIKGTSNITTGLAEVADSLDEVAKDGDRAGDKLADAFGEKIEDGFRAAGRAADDLADKIDSATDDIKSDAAAAAEKIEKKFSSSYKEVTADAKKMAKASGEEFKGMGTDASEGLKEFKGEAAQSAKEAAASFDGSADSIADMFQETAAQAFAGFGPAGAAAGIAAAAGLGVAMNYLGVMGEKAAAAAESVGDLTEQFIDLGADGARSATAMAERLREAATSVEDGEVKFDKWSETAERAKISVEDFTVAMVGGAEQAARSQDEVGQKLDEVDEKWQSVLARGQQPETMYPGITAQKDALQEAKAALEATVEAYKKADENAAGYAKTVANELNPAEIAAAAATAEYEKAVTGALERAGQSWKDYTQDGKVNLDAYNLAIEKQAAAIKSYEENLVKAAEHMSQAALDEVKRMGPEAAPLLQAFVDAPLAQKQRTARNLEELGKASTEGYKQGAKLEQATRDEIARANAHAQANPIRIHTQVNKEALQAQVNSMIASISAWLPVHTRPGGSTL